MRKAAKAARWLWLGMVIFIVSVSLLTWTITQTGNILDKLWPGIFVLVGILLMVVSGWVMYNEWFPDPDEKKDGSSDLKWMEPPSRPG